MAKFQPSKIDLSALIAGLINFVIKKVYFTNKWCFFQVRLEILLTLTSAAEILCFQKEVVKTACANGLDIQPLPGNP